MCNRIVLLLLVVSVVVFSTKATSAALYRTAALIDEGEAFAEDPMFDSQGWLRGVNDAGDGFIAGGAVLIDPYWVLTATHVTLWTGNDQPFAELSFSLSNSIFEDERNSVDVAEWFTFPGYDPFPGRGNDIALVRLVEPIFDVVPAERFRGTDQVGTRIYAVGYGQPGTWPNERPFDGVQRAGENIVDCFGCLAATDNNYMLADFGPGSGTSGLPLEWTSSNLDSGGGWFADIDETMQLVGFTNFSRGNSTRTGATRISLYNDWIDSYVVNIPEPSSLLLFVLGSLSLLFRRRCICKAA